MAAANAERRVRPRLAANAPVSPLADRLRWWWWCGGGVVVVRILQDGVEAGLVVKDSDHNGGIYTGFLQWQHVKASNCRFEAMNSNRAINDSVVEARFRENLDELAEHGRFKDFGQINLLILLNDPQHVFYVMDGQHRCRVMERLHRHTDRDIKFQFRAKAVVDPRELIHFQNAYPSDPRAFFSTRRARQVGTSVLQRLRTKFQSQERDIEDLWVDVTTFRAGKRTGDPNRPKLNDFLIFWLLQDSELLNDVQVFEHLLKMNALMQRLANDQRAKLGLSASRNVLFRPCRHVCCCSDCAESQDRCPVCREPAELKENVYVP
eukprot:Skav222786  [mRNA]  locus=scaffold1254:40855:52469:+ [translate_table: standard]